MRVTLTLSLACGMALGASALLNAQTPGKAPPASSAPPSSSPAATPPGNRLPGKPPATPPAEAADFRTLDKNNDGFVSAAEAEPAGALHDVFASLDRNQDGKLSAMEFAAWNGADKSKTPMPVSPATGPGGSGNAQHMPDSEHAPR